jgi:alcohol-forming fatty acyl-CoA reductase
VVLPLAISYDRIAEEAGFLRELDGSARHRGGLKSLARWFRQELRKGGIRLGRIHIRCGAPLPLEPHTDVPALGRAVVAELQKNTVATMFHLRTFCDGHPELGIDAGRAPRRHRAARRRRAREPPRRAPTPIVPELVRRTYEAQWMHLFYGDALERFRRRRRGRRARPPQRLLVPACRGRRRPGDGPAW